MAINADNISTSTEPSCQLPASSSQNSLPGCSSLVCLREEDVPGASLNGREPGQLHVVELKLVRVVSYYNSWEEAEPCEALSRLYNSVIMIYLSNIKSIAENQRSTAAATFGAGAMRHREEGYCLFR